MKQTCCWGPINCPSNARIHAANNWLFGANVSGLHTSGWHLDSCELCAHLQDADTAKKLAFHPGVRMRCVTLAGDLYNPSGECTYLSVLVLPTPHMWLTKLAFCWCFICSPLCPHMTLLPGGFVLLVTTSQQPYIRAMYSVCSQTTVFCVGHKLLCCCLLGTLRGGSRDLGACVLARLHNVLEAEQELQAHQHVLATANEELSKLAGTAEEHRRYGKCPVVVTDSASWEQERTWCWEG